MKDDFEGLLEEEIIEKRLADGEDPKDMVDVLTREANLIIDRHNLEYELGMVPKV